MVRYLNITRRHFQNFISFQAYSNNSINLPIHYRHPNGFLLRSSYRSEIGVQNENLLIGTRVMNFKLENIGIGKAFLYSLVTHWNLNLNGILVLISSSILIIASLLYAIYSFVSCVCGKRRNSRVFETLETHDLEILAEDKETAALTEYDFGLYNVDDPLPIDFRRVSIDKDLRKKISTKKSTNSKSAIKKRVILKLDNDLESQADASTITESTIATSESSSLFGNRQKSNLASTTPVATSAYFDQPDNGEEADNDGSDSRILKTLLTVLGQGMTITKYNEKGLKQIHLHLADGVELRWRTVKMFAKKGKKLNLREVRFVNWGKQTKKFHMPVARNAFDEHCFSLVTGSDTVDFEARNVVERDALAQGFSILVNRLKGIKPSGSEAVLNPSNKL